MNKPCTINTPHCQLCGSTDYEDLNAGDQGYTACCNEPVECDSRHCPGGHTR